MALIKAREVRERLKGRVDPEVMSILCTLAEQTVGQEKAIAEVAMMLDQMTKIVSNFTHVAHNMKSAMDTITGQRGILPNEQQKGES